VSGTYSYLAEMYFTASVLPQREIEERWLVAGWLFAIDPDDLARTLTADAAAKLWGLGGLVTVDSRALKAIKADARRVIQQYRQIAGQVPAAGLPRYHADYILYSQEDLSRVRRTMGDAWLGREVFSENGLTLWTAPSSISTVMERANP